MSDKATGQHSRSLLQAERIKRYAHLIEQQTGKVVRPARYDGYVNLINRYGTDKDISEHYQYQSEPAVPDETLAEFYEGNGLFAKIIDAPAEEAVKHGFTLEDVKDQEIIDFYQEALEELDWDETAINAIRWARLFGGSIAVMLINDGRGIDEPLDWKNIQSIDDIRVYDRSVIQPDFTSMFSYSHNDPFRTRGSRLGMPEYYNVYSKYGAFTVHESRCLVFQNGVLPENCSNSIYELWGMPEYIRIKRAIRDSELAHSNGPKLLEKSVQAVYKMRDLAAELATEEGEARVLRRLQVIDMARGILNSIAIDNDNEDYDFKSFQFSGVSEIIDTTCNQLSALTNIPQTILFGRSPAGMNSTGTSDLENWYNFIGRIQKKMLKSNLRYLLSIIFQAGMHTGEVSEVPKIKPVFSPLWSMSELEQAQLEQTKANTQQTKANTAQIYVSMQALDPSEIRKKLADSEEFDVENILDDLEDEDIESFIDNLAEDTPDSAGAESEGNSSAAAPAATKLPQDMTEADKMQQAVKGAETDNTDEDIHTPNEEANASGVGVIVISDGKILTGTRHNDSGYGLICGPGGHIDKGETPSQAAFRETEEEFGISPKELIPLGFGPKEPETGLMPIIYLCTDFNGTPECADLEMANPQFRTLEEIQQMDAVLYPPFKDSLEVLLDLFNNDDLLEDDYSEDDRVDSAEEKNQSTKTIISEKPIDLSAKTSIIKSKDTTTVNTDFGVKGMKWGKTKEEEEPKPEGVKKTKVTKFKTKDGVMTVTSDTKARLGAKGAATIKKGKITEVQVFAGKGGKKPMDLADKFANTYGGKSSDWMHSTGNGKIKLSDGTEKDAEIHWFECEGVGQTKWKIKKFKKG